MVAERSCEERVKPSPNATVHKILTATKVTFRECT